MVDSVYVRFVDEQCAQLDWLLAYHADAEPSTLADKSLLQAVSAMAELVLIGFFAEQTQKRFKPALWQGLVAVGPSFEALALHIKEAESILAHWRLMERDDDSPFAIVLRAIHQRKMPATSHYRSSLLSETTLAEPAFTPLIASSTHLPDVQISQFISAWRLLLEQIALDRSVSLEC